MNLITLFLNNNKKGTKTVMDGKGGIATVFTNKNGTQTMIDGKGNLTTIFANNRR